MKIRVTLLNGATIDFDATPDFNFVGWVMSIRETGRWLVDTVYVPHDQIVSALKLDESGKPLSPKGEGVLQ